MATSFVRHPARLLAAVLGVLLTVTGLASASTSAAFTDSATVQLEVRGAHWATSVCVIQSPETRPDIAYTLTSSDLLRDRGWTTVLDKRAASTAADLAGCDVVMIAGESWTISAASRALAEDWTAAGGSVLSTGNDTGAATLPNFIGSQGDLRADYPFGGSVPASASVRGSLSPQFPSWTPGPLGTWTVDTTGRPITSVAAGALCVATVAGHPDWCAAIVRTTPAGGRWVHLHSKIGSPSSPGDAPGADAALAWLAIGRN
ncbi:MULTISPECIES: hypothetical protein [Cellulomonas]|uniref:ThuA-like domain-containing protein n=1 Tax=Cellulomonas denverensis TaxID=264297 RepID=A0A7X6KY42_9CELL|nr:MULTISPECIES: hypothetical protein [Cellulomonas]NKY24331.1 hypothetical protein [Cellulomonas denverensis]QZN87799.1 hypothetical protein K5O09_18575 [Cellulomonas sp. C5510]GIG27305.1 hypothetical protein Cde04nite_35490 [Cellulomonas denverensis]